jgi:2-C-methyl-D-erythritol 4-phosphate cytidylyltransferase
MPDFAVILPAAGKSTRYGGSRGKLQEPLAGQTVLEHSLAAFTRREDVVCIVVAGGTSLGISASTRIVPCEGGTCRAVSVRNALLAISPEIEWVAVHDAARPLVSQDLIDRTLAAAVRFGAAVPALAVAQTIRRAQGPLPAKSSGVVSRSELWAMQTPQIMRRRDLLEGYKRCTVALEEITDDVQLLELAGKEVWIVQGEERNLKITTPIDLLIARTVLSMDSAIPPAVEAKPPGR